MGGGDKSGSTNDVLGGSGGSGIVGVGAAGAAAYKVEDWKEFMIQHCPRSMQYLQSYYDPDPFFLKRPDGNFPSHEISETFSSVYIYPFLLRTIIRIVL
tara:strand:+ start:759 stop:1055 length:297 start_codon:yes stop_codon:yes gene_type:complete